MELAILILVYIVGTGGMFTRLMILDKKSMRHPFTTPKRRFWIYLLIALLWPVTIWLWMFSYWSNCH